MGWLKRCCLQSKNEILVLNWFLPQGSNLFSYKKTTFSSVLCFNHNTDAYLWKVDISRCSIGRIMCLFHIPTPYPRFVFLTTPSHPSPSNVAQQMDALQPKSIKIQKYQTILQQKTQNLFLDFIPSEEKIP